MRSHSDRGLTALLAFALTAGCGAASFNATREQAFNEAVESSLDEDHADAARAAQQYLKGSSQDDARYDRALTILAEAMERLDLTYAASLYFLDTASQRRDPDVLDRAYAGLERIVMGDIPVDEPVLVAGFLATQEVSGLAPERTDFIAYMQGRQSVRQGLDQWADEQFAGIATDSPYRKRADYVKAVRLLRQRDFEPAHQALVALAEDEEAEEQVRMDARQALARLAMEQGRYDEAVEHYETVRTRAREQPELLLEMAWAHYYRGDSKRSLGLLVALDAPVYRGLIAPERYLLEARLLRRLCQFEPARLAAVRLSRRHGDALDDLHAGIRPPESVSIREGARRRGAGWTSSRVRRRLERELSRVDDLSGPFGEHLTKTLTELYKVGISHARRAEEAALAVETERLAQELVAAEDGVQIILHELSVGLLRGRRRPDGPTEIESVTYDVGGDNISYRFAGEFWSDELDDMIVVIDNRCLD